MKHKMEKPKSRPEKYRPGKHAVNHAPPTAAARRPCAKVREAVALLRHIAGILDGLHELELEQLHTLRRISSGSQ
jgi:hypothetical protein